jgi:hypothetical protein
MKRAIFQTVVALVACHGVAWANDKFERVSVYLEQTVEDEDSEVTFEAISGAVGLAALKVAAPDGRIVVDFKATDSKLGMRHLVLETPEPKNDGKVPADFPAGLYRFTGTLTTGKELLGEATLSHKLPDPARIVHPRPNERNISTTGMQVKWNPVRDVAKYVVVIEQEKTGREYKADLNAGATSFTVSDGFLVPGLEYKLAIGTVGKDGNRSFTESAFVTAPGK